MGAEKEGVLIEVVERAPKHGVLGSSHRVHFSFLSIPFSKHLIILTLMVVSISIMF